MKKLEELLRRGVLLVVGSPRRAEWIRSVSALVLLLAAVIALTAYSSYPSIIKIEPPTEEALSISEPLPTEEPFISKEFLMRVIWTESEYKIDARNSKSGARGLMQITPIALKEYNRFNSPRLTFDDMWDPELNVIVGTWLLEYYVERLTYLNGVEPTYQQLYVAYNAGYVDCWKYYDSYYSRGRTPKGDRYRALERFETSVNFISYVD